MKFVIVGAHSAVGRALAEALEDQEVKVVRATTVDHLDDGLDLLQETTLNGADLVFLAEVSSFTRQLAAGAARLSAPLINLSGVANHGGQLLWPTGGDIEQLRQPGLFRVPMGCVYGVVTLVRELQRWRPNRLRVVTFEGVAGAGQPGMDELSKLTRGLFSHQSLEPEVFYAPPAFNVLPSVEDGEDPFAADRQLEADIREGLRELDIEVGVTRTRVPVFTAEGAWIELCCEDAMALEDMRVAVDALKGLRLADSPGSTTLDAVDLDDGLVSRLRVERDRVDLWLSLDRLRHGGAWPAVVLAERFLAC
ncbi:MAG: hypothetical protein KTR25_09480 [Myxococcales bacterium]|nr:hypothetical protein [Myxococcales bacterium]